MSEGFDSARNVQAPAIGGLRPGVDARQVTEGPFVLDGQNFLVLPKGPVSAFASRIAGLRQMPGYYQSTLIDGRELILTDSRFYWYDEATQSVVPAFNFSDQELGYPWTVAEVANSYYFAKRGVPAIIRYRPSDGLWSEDFDSVPDPYAVTQAAGRLLVLNDTRYYYSALDDGTDLVPSLTTGAGSQGLSIIGGKGVMIAETADGALVYTTSGVVKAEFSNGPTPFRHYPMDRDHVPVNPWCVGIMEDRTHIVLTRKGLYQTNGGRLEPWEQLFSSFLANDLFPKIDMNQHYSPRVRAFSDHSLLMLEFVTAATFRVVDHAYVYQMTRGEWGSFDMPNRGVLRFNTELSQPAGPQLGFIDLDGWIRKFTNSGVNYSSPPNSTYSAGGAIAEEGSWTDAESFTAMCRMRIRTELVVPPSRSPGLYGEVAFATARSPEVIGDITIPTSNLDGGNQDYMVTGTNEDWLLVGADEDWMPYFLPASMIQMAAEGDYQDTRVFTASQIVLPSYVDIGLFRMQGLQYADELTSITDVAITTATLSKESDYEDFMLSGGDEDFMAVSSLNEDWLDTSISRNGNFELSWTGTLDDGQTIYPGNQAVLVESPTLNAAARHFSVDGINGIWHKGRVRLTEPGATFQLSLMQATGINGGRL